MNERPPTDHESRTDSPRAAAAAGARAGAPIGQCALLASLATGALGMGMAGLWLGLEARGWLVASLMLATISAIVVRGLPGHHPFPRFGPANLVTLGRAGLVCALAGSMVGSVAGSVADSIAGPAADSLAPASIGSQERALVRGMAPSWVPWLLAGLAALLDAVDGWLARRAHLASRFGARFDLEIDALLILVLSALAWRWERAGAWILASGAMRYVFVAAMSVRPWLGAPLPPSTRRKAVCALQVVSLLACLLPIVPAAPAQAVAARGLAALTLSFAIDIRWLWRRHRAACDDR